MKKLALILVKWSACFLMPMPGANPVLVREGGSHTVRQAANLFNDGSISASAYAPTEV